MEITVGLIKLLGEMIIGEKYGSFRRTDGAQQLFTKAGWTTTRQCPGTGWEEWASEQLGFWVQADPQAIVKLLVTMAGPDEFLQNGRVDVARRNATIARWNGHLAIVGLQIRATGTAPARVDFIAPGYLPLEEPKAAVSTEFLAQEMRLFLQRYPNPEKCIFIMMQFGSTAPSKAMADAVKRALSKHGFIGLRADDHQFSRLLWLNIQTYMHACRAGLAIFDRLENDIYNSNIALEAGYMLGLGKPVGFLKERTVRGLQTDLTGHIWYDFDVHVATTIETAVDKWLSNEPADLLAPMGASF